MTLNYWNKKMIFIISMNITKKIIKRVTRNRRQGKWECYCNPGCWGESSNILREVFNNRSTVSLTWKIKEPEFPNWLYITSFRHSNVLWITFLMFAQVRLVGIFNFLFFCITADTVTMQPLMATSPWADKKPWKQTYNAITKGHSYKQASRGVYSSLAWFVESSLSFWDFYHRNYIKLYMY